MPDNPISQTTNAGSLDLSTITQEFLNSPEVTGATTATPVTPEVTQETSPETPPLTPTAPVTPSLTEGQEPPPTDPQEAYRGFLRDDDYRRKTMRLAEERRAFEAERAQVQQQAQQAAQQAQLVQQQYEEALANPQFLQQRWNQIHGQVQAQQGGVAPTVEQVNQLLQTQLTQAKQEMAAYVRQIEVARNTAEYDSQRIQYGQQLVSKDFPVLQDQPGVDTLIFQEAWKRSPSNMNELKQFMKEDAEHRAKLAEKRISEREQAAIMRHEKTKKASIEPKGGNAPLLQTPHRKAKLGSQDLLSQTLADIELEQQASR
jgi:hypothetical protein